uniref:Bm9618 n=2 Tax=Brugia malayi TaxID=6279 RepID=A0A0H5S5G3_BRUMA|nr:Bm9618 [Brugia malayi]
MLFWKSKEATMVQLVRAQSAVVLRPSYSTTIYRTRSVPDLSLYSRYTPKWPYRYCRDWDMYDDYWYDRYYYYSPLYRSTFFPRRYYYYDYVLNPYSYWSYPYNYWTRYRGYLYGYPSYYSRYHYCYDDYPHYRYTYSYPYRYGYYSPFDRYWLSSTYWNRRFREVGLKLNPSYSELQRIYQ